MKQGMGRSPGGNVTEQAITEVTELNVSSSQEMKHMINLPDSWYLCSLKKYFIDLFFSFLFFLWGRMGREDGDISAMFRTTDCTQGSLEAELGDI